MKKDPLDKIIEDYSRRPYIDSMLLISSLSGPILTTRKSQAPEEPMASLLSVTYEGTKELVNSAGFKLSEVDVKTHSGHSIIIKPLNESYFLAVQVKTYDQRILEEIDNLVTLIEPRICDLDH
ncbi:MAG: hypothetical protein ACP5UO_02830 [Thermoplasmata archaeon]